MGIYDEFITEEQYAILDTYAEHYSRVRNVMIKLRNGRNPIDPVEEMHLFGGSFKYRLECLKQDIERIEFWLDRYMCDSEQEKGAMTD